MSRRFRTQDFEETPHRGSRYPDGTPYHPRYRLEEPQHPPGGALNWIGRSQDSLTPVGHTFDSGGPTTGSNPAYPVVNIDPTPRYNTGTNLVPADNRVGNVISDYIWPALTNYVGPHLAEGTNYVLDNVGDNATWWQAALKLARLGRRIVRNWRNTQQEDMQDGTSESKSAEQAPSVAETNASAPSTTAYSSAGSAYAGRGRKRPRDDSCNTPIGRAINEYFQCRNPLRWLYSDGTLVFAPPTSPSTPANAVWNTTTTTTYLLNSIDSGSEQYNRQGRRVTLHRLEIRGTVLPLNVTALLTSNAAQKVFGGALRILVVFDTQANGAIFNPPDILSQYNYKDPVLEPTGSERFIILKDETINAEYIYNLAGSGTTPIPSSVSPTKLFHADINLEGLETTYKNTTGVIANIVTGSLHIVCFNINGHPTDSSQNWAIQFTSNLFFRS